jgi:hypothetical protein
MSSLTFLLLLLAAWIPCALWVGRSNWRDEQHASLIERVAGTAWLAALGGLALAAGGVFVVSLVVIAVSAVF